MIDWDALVIGPTVSTFGEGVQYQPVGRASFTIQGVFDEGYLEQAPLDIVMPGNITARRPVLGVQLSQFSGRCEPEQSDVVTIARTGQVFWVNEVRPDGHGHALLLLGTACP